MGCALIFWPGLSLMHSGSRSDAIRLNLSADKRVQIGSVLAPQARCYLKAIGTQTLH